jgi:hypothetical protein
MRPRLIAVVAAVSLIAAACSDDGAATTSEPTATASVPTTRAIPVDPDIVPEGDPDLLAAVVFFPGDLPAPYDDLAFDAVESGYRPAGGSLSNALDPQDEADDIVRFGQVAEFATAFGDPNEVGVAFNASQFATPAGAEAYINDWVEDLRSVSGVASDDRFSLTDFQSEVLEGLGDQAVRVGYLSNFMLADGTTRTRPGGAVVVRKGSLALWLWGNGDQTEQILDDLAVATADRVVAAADGSTPPRDHTTLGLTDPPTLALDSFAFVYEYGIEASVEGFTVTIDGVFEGPDRASCRTAVSVGDLEPLETFLIVAGTRVWLGDFTGYQELTLRDPAALNALTSCPGHPNHWELTRLHRLEVTDGTAVTVSEVPALRADLVDDREAMEAAGFFGAEIDEFTRYELTVAADGGWPIQLDVERSMDIEAALRMFGMPSGDLVDPGVPAIVFKRLLLTRINDPTIKVDLPLLTG